MSSVPFDDAYLACERLAREHYENFPVASWLLPRDMRPHVAAVYAFARTADDFADEEGRAPADRQALLADWGDRLRAAVEPGADPQHPVFRALARTIRARELPLALFEDLLSAFRQDTTTFRYDTWDALADYCRRSANPVGRLVLRVAGHVDPEMDRASDAICTALQLTNFWQDLERDWRQGRLYVPREEYARAGARLEDLDRRALTPEWRAALAAAASRTRALFDEGRWLCGAVPGRLGWELRLTWLGGVRILERLERCGYDVFRARPVLGAGDALPIAWRALTWAANRPRPM